MLWTNREHVRVNAAFEEMFSCLRVSGAWMTGQRQSQLVATNVSMYLLLWPAGWHSWGPVSRIAFAAIELEIKFWGNVCNAWLGWPKILDFGSCQCHWAAPALIPNSKLGKLQVIIHKFMATPHCACATDVSIVGSVTLILFSDNGN